MLIKFIYLCIWNALDLSCLHVCKYRQIPISGDQLNLIINQLINLSLYTIRVLFPETTVLDVLNIFGALPEEAAALRKASAHVEKLKTVVNTRTVTAETKAEREKNIVNMYNSGHSIDDIWKVSGFSSRSSVFRILNKFGVDLNRGKFKGPLGKRQSKE